MIVLPEGMSFMIHSEDNMQQTQQPMIWVTGATIEQRCGAFLDQAKAFLAEASDVHERLIKEHERVHGSMSFWYAQYLRRDTHKIIIEMVNQINELLAMTAKADDGRVLIGPKEAALLDDTSDKYGDDFFQKQIMAWEDEIHELSYRPSAHGVVIVEDEEADADQARPDHYQHSLMVAMFSSAIAVICVLALYKMSVVP